MKVQRMPNQFPELPKPPRLAGDASAGKAAEAVAPFTEIMRKRKAPPKAAASLGKDAAPRAQDKVEFSETFLNVAESSLKASLDQLVAGIQEQGERLARQQNFEQLNRYKELVRSFLRKVSQDLYKVRASNGASPLPGQKVYIILQKVDLELEKLSKLVMAGQVPQLRILERLDLIRGLLFDAYK
jgi:uncharacterized protein YaaR (DUF327 family)